MTVEDLPTRGLLPDVPDAVPFRDGARRLLEASCYLGPVRDPVRSTYEVSRSPPKLLLPSSNDNVAQLLLADITLRTAVGDWMSANLEQWRVDVRQNLDVFNLVARRPGRESNLAVSGEGIQQVLPFVTLCCWRRLGLGSRPFLDVIEQPELHLHDAAHAPLGDLLLDAVAGGGGNIVFETHSESLVLRLRRRVSEGLSPEQVALLYVEDTGEGSRIRAIPLGPDGEVEWWPEGVFSESFVELKAIRRAQRARGIIK
jgi:predicted ATPase